MNAQELAVLPLEESVEILAAQGLSKKQIADSLGMDRVTLWRKEKQNRNIRNALKRGKAAGLVVATSNLLKQSNEGNVAATIFYLKNRDPERWRDRRDLEVSSPGSYVINAAPASVEDWASEHGIPIEGQSERLQSTLTGDRDEGQGNP